MLETELAEGGLSGAEPAEQAEKVLEEDRVRSWGPFGFRTIVR